MINRRKKTTILDILDLLEIAPDDRDFAFVNFPIRSIFQKTPSYFFLPFLLLLLPTFWDLRIHAELKTTVILLTH